MIESSIKKEGTCQPSADIASFRKGPQDQTLDMLMKKLIPKPRKDWSITTDDGLFELIMAGIDHPIRFKSHDLKSFDNSLANGGIQRG